MALAPFAVRPEFRDGAGGISIFEKQPRASSPNSAEVGIFRLGRRGARGRILVRVVAAGPCAAAVTRHSDPKHRKRDADDPDYEPTSHERPLLGPICTTTPTRRGE